MKNSYLSMAIATGMVIFSPNFAKSSDLLDGLNDPAPTQGVTVNWSGFYVGGAIGYGNANHDLTARRYNGDYCWDVDGDGVSPIAPIDPTDPWSGSVDHDTSEGHVDNRLADGSCDGAGFLDTETGPYSGGGTEHHGDGENWSENDHATVNASSREIASLDGLNSTGVVGDVRIGYDQQMGRFVVGVFGTYGFSNMDADGTFGAGNFTLERGDDWSVGGRAGILVNNSTLLYALAAYTQTEYKFSGVHNAVPFSKETTFDGVTVGGGIEFAVSDNVFFGLEGTHTFYNDETIFDTGASDIGGFGSSIEDELSETKILGTLKIKLSSF